MSPDVLALFVLLLITHNVREPCDDNDIQTDWKFSLTLLNAFSEAISCSCLFWDAHTALLEIIPLGGFFLQYLNNSLGNKITFFHSIENCFVYCSISNFIEFNFLSSVVYSQKVLKRELNIDTMMTRKKQLQKRILTIVNSTIPDSQYSTSKALFTFFLFLSKHQQQHIHQVS